ncbi:MULTISPECIES: hypothetical protein [unclassified Lentimonas]|uniref:hypothetical protein n=1 Tax=unclassified Lentimonas TaxID=2630993 RepID=UPI001327A403|nr:MULTISPECIES: hypothetical protein [unclassified Lentimonas]CAA6694988.1 Unannotated [Lentimonas sp. CC19]CAA6695347.1 Unannotated [Lentimonas sp. CC10]CAA7072019.1 Unannotated [Lentimonas sp. CC11]
MNSLPGIPFRPLGLIMNVIEGCGFNLGHLHDDLIFTEENVILLKMEEEPATVSFYVNQDCEARAIPDMEATLCIGAREEGLNFIKRGSYSLEPNGEKSFNVVFSGSAA